MDDNKNSKFTYVMVKESVYQILLSLPNRSKKYNEKYIKAIKEVKKEAQIVESLENSENTDLRRLAKSMGGINRLALIGIDLPFEYNSFLIAYEDCFKRGVSNSMESRFREDLHIFCLMNDLRKIWTVQSGNGSSETNLDLHLKYQRQLVSLIEPKKNKI